MIINFEWGNKSGGTYSFYQSKIKISFINPPTNYNCNKAKDKLIKVITKFMKDR